MAEQDELSFLLEERRHLDERIRSLQKAFEPLPEGDYEATITVVERKQGAHSGKWYWCIQFDITSGLYQGRRVWANVVEVLPPMFHQLQYATGVQLSYQIAWADSGASSGPVAFVGHDVEIELIRARHSGKHFNEVRSIKKPSL